jgi:transposase
LSPEQKDIIRQPERANKHTLRAWQLKAELRDVLAMPLVAGRKALDDRLSYATRPRPAPFVKLARTILHCRKSLEATPECKLTNGISASNNTAAARIRSEAEGTHDPESFITMVMLAEAGIAPPPPWAN